MTTKTEPMLVIRDAEGRTLAILPQALSQEALTLIVQALQGFSTTELGPPTAIDRPSASEREIIAAALPNGGGKYAGKNPLATLLEGEPFFFARARDVLAPAAVDAYGLALEAGANALALGAPMTKTKHLPIVAGLVAASAEIRELAGAMRAWQTKNQPAVKLPD